MGLLFYKDLPKVVFDMQIYESLCVCAIIAGASGAIGRACARLEISPFALAFSGALLLMLSQFSFAPLAEFRCNTGTLVFPVYFLIQMVEQRGLNVRAAATWRAFFAASTLPVVWMLVSALAELWRLDYASVNLDGIALRNAQAILCATTFGSMLLHAALHEKRKTV
jgi:hypothetical protein